MFFPAAAKELASLKPKFGDLNTHNSNLFDLVGSKNGYFELSSPCSQIADISDPRGSIMDLL